MIILIILFSVLVGIAFSSLSSLQSTSSNIIYSKGYYDNGDVNITVLATNQYGSPISTLPVSIGYNGTTVNGTTDSAGWANLTFKAYNETAIYYNVSSVTANSGYASNYQVFNFSQLPKYNGSVTKEELVYTSLIMGFVPQSGNLLNNSITMFYVGLNGTAAPPIYLYAQYFTGAPGSYTIGQNISTKNLTLIGEYSGFNYVVVKPTNLAFSSNGTGLYRVYALSSNDTLYNEAIMQLHNQVSPTSISNLFFAIVDSLFGFMIPILAIFSAYLYFSKDKTNGVMESILSRPVTRGRLIVSRFTANVIVSLVAVAAGILTLDILSARFTGSLMSAFVVENIIWMFFVVATGFIGIIYLLTQFFRSTGSILGISVSLYIVLSLLWTFLIVPLLLLLFAHGSTGTLLYDRDYLIINSLNPAGYPRLVGLYAFGNSTGISLSTLGLTLPVLIGVGLAWIIIPFALAYLLARNRDWLSST